MALDAGPFIRTGTRGSPSWPGSNPETGYVDADCSDQSAEAAFRPAGPYVWGVSSYNRPRADSAGAGAVKRYHTAQADRENPFAGGRRKNARGL